MFYKNPSADTNYFPKHKQLENKLLIFNLGYFSFKHFCDLQEKQIFFLSRTKSNVRVKILIVKQGLTKDFNGKDLTHDSLPENIPLIEFDADLGSDYDSILKSRAIGVWNTKRRNTIGI